MLDGDSDLARNNALTSKVGQTLEESQRGFDKWAPTYEQVSCMDLTTFLLTTNQKTLYMYKGDPILGALGVRPYTVRKVPIQTT